MTKKQLATLIVETEFNKKYKTVLDDFDNSDYKKLLKVRIKFLKLMKVLFILVGALSFFTLLFGALDLAYSQDTPGKGASTAIIGVLSISIIVSCLYNFPIKIIKNVFDVNCDKKPIGKYCFNGFDEYMLNGSNYEHFEKIFVDNGINVRVNRGTRESITRFYKSKNLYCKLVILLYFIIHIVSLITLTKIEFENQSNYINILYVYLVILSVTMAIIVVFLITTIIRNRKNLKEFLKNDYEYNYFEVVKSDPNIRKFTKKNSPFLEKVYLMDVILDQKDNHYNFINSNNYAEFLGELAESLTYELVAFEDEFRYLLANDNFTENEYFKMSIDICIAGLCKLDRSELNSLYAENKKSVMMIEENHLLERSILSVGDYFISSNRGQSSSLAIHGKKLTFGIDEYNRNIKTDSRVAQLSMTIDATMGYIRKIFSIIPKYAAPLSYHYVGLSLIYRFFQPYFCKQRGFGFVGFDSSFLQVLFNPAQTHELSKKYKPCKEFDSGNMYKSYQFVLTGENPLKKQGEYFVSEGALKNQLFYQNMLILSEAVVDIIKDYCILTPIEVRYGNQSETYYICEPTTYDKEVLNEQMSLYFEEFGNRLVKHSFLIEPCIIKDRAEELKVFGVVSKRIKEYQYIKDHQYSYIMFTEEIKNLLSGFDDLAIIRNERGVGSDIREEKHNIVSLKSDDEIVLDIANEDFSMFVNKSKYSYSKEERVMYTIHNMKLIFNVALCIALIVGLNYYIYNIPTHLFSNIPEAQIRTIRALRMLNILVAPLLFYMYFVYKRFVISPITVIKQGKLLHRVRSVFGFGKSSVRYHTVLDDDLNMAFHKNKIMFELPIENKFKYIDDELYYNGTSYALNGIEVDMEKAVDKGESFVHEVHNVYYQSNQVWKKIRER